MSPLPQTPTFLSSQASSPRRRGSRGPVRLKRGYGACLYARNRNAPWIPASAGMTKGMKIWRLIASLLILCSACLAPLPAQAGLRSPAFDKGSAIIDTRDGRHVTFQVEMARTPEQQAYGLMNRQKLTSTEGMLFIFAPPRPVTFWMKDTPLSLDMLFIDEKGRVLQIHDQAKPFDETPITAPHPVAYVLEIKGGQARYLGLRVGDTLKTDEGFSSGPR